jgi:hypothetical protein
MLKIEYVEAGISRPLSRVSKRAPVPEFCSPCRQAPMSSEYRRTGACSVPQPYHLVGEKYLTAVLDAAGGCR